MAHYPEYDKKYQKKRSLEKKKILDKIKDVPCADCGLKFPPYCMDFDHRNPLTKAFTIGAVNLSMNRILLEVAKCDIVCANCHRKRTWGAK